jgi:hypothetical protein
MANDNTVFADAIAEAHVANGVARIALVQAGADGKPALSGLLIVPLTRLPAVANALVGLLQQIEATVKEAQAEAQANAQAQAEAASATPTDGAGTSAFRFGN